MSRRPQAKDQRDPRVALDNPPFGDPAWARKCPKCELWYPWAAFHKPIRSNQFRGAKSGRHGTSHYVRCLVCRIADGATSKAKTPAR